jgi:phage gpG-like protein
MTPERVVEIEAALKGFEESMKKKREALPPAGRKGLYLWAEGALGKFKVDRLSGAGGLNVITGDLRRSFLHRETGEVLANLESHLFTTSKYAAIHEFGGTIRPKSAKMLAIPIKGSPATRASGEPLYHSPLRQTLPQTLDFFVDERGTGRFFLIDETGQAWFRLVPSVKIPARMRFRETIKAQILQLQERLKEQFGAALQSA